MRESAAISIQLRIERESKLPRLQFKETVRKERYL